MIDVRDGLFIGRHARCPECGGKIQSISLGWMCKTCELFIDMHGIPHPHEPKPFMPPMTNGDYLRSLGDEALADYLELLCFKRGTWAWDKDDWRKWLKEPYAEGEKI